MSDESLSPTALSLLYETLTFPVKPSLVICDAKSEYGKKILSERDGEMDFDGFHHAYINREGTTFLVPLWEWQENE